jgi:hypothetical protein
MGCFSIFLHLCLHQVLITDSGHCSENREQLNSPVILDYLDSETKMSKPQSDSHISTCWSQSLMIMLFKEPSFPRTPWIVTMKTFWFFTPVCESTETVERQDGRFQFCFLWSLWCVWRWGNSYLLPVTLFTPTPGNIQWSCFHVFATILC